MAVSNTWQLLVDITRMSNLESGLVTPPIFKTKLSRGCTSVKLIDVNKEEYTMGVEGCSSRRVKLVNANWVRFLDRRIDRETAKLYFKLVADDTFDVICFDRYDMQTVEHNNGVVTIERCLVKASEETMEEEYLAGPLLENLDGTTKRKPWKDATLYGRRQNANVQVIYEYEDHSDSEDDEVKVEEGEEERKVYWHAVGVTGRTWTNFCLVNNIVPGHIIMFTKANDGTYLVDVFTDKGVGLGVATSETQQKLVKYDSDDEETTKVGKHKCRVRHHKHSSKNTKFPTRFPYHTLTNSQLTIPKSVVRPHDLHTYNRARLTYGDMKFPALLAVKRDSRPGRDQKHVVMMADWERFLAKTGLEVGSKIRFELNLKKTVRGGLVEFDVC